MSDTEPKPLVVIITRTHCEKGSVFDEYESYWQDGTKEYSDSHRFDHRLGETDFALLLLQGHNDMKNDQWQCIKDMLLLPCNHNRKPNDYSNIFVFTHSSAENSKENAAKVEADVNISVKWVIFSSGGSSQSSCDILLKQLMSELKTKDSIKGNIEKLVEVVHGWMKGFQYKIMKLQLAREHLMELRLLIDATHHLDINKNNSVDLKDILSKFKKVIKGLRDLIEKHPLELIKLTRVPNEVKLRPIRHEIFSKLKNDPCDPLFLMFSEGNSPHENELNDKSGFWRNLISIRSRNYMLANEVFRKKIKGNVSIESVREDFANISRSINCIECEFRELQRTEQST